MNEMKKDTFSMEYEEWYEEHGDELWIIYHEEGADFDQNYEDWCEKKYDSLRQ